MFFQQSREMFSSMTFLDFLESSWKMFLIIQTTNHSCTLGRSQFSSTWRVRIRSFSSTRKRCLAAFVPRGAKPLILKPWGEVVKRAHFTIQNSDVHSAGLKILMNMRSVQAAHQEALAGRFCLLSAAQEALHETLHCESKAHALPCRQARCPAVFALQMIPSFVGVVNLLHSLGFNKNEQYSKSPWGGFALQHHAALDLSLFRNLYCYMVGNSASDLGISTPKHWRCLFFPPGLAWEILTRRSLESHSIHWTQTHRLDRARLDEEVSSRLEMWVNSVNEIFGDLLWNW